MGWAKANRGSSNWLLSIGYPLCMEEFMSTIVGLINIDFVKGFDELNNNSIIG